MSEEDILKQTDSAQKSDSEIKVDLATMRHLAELSSIEMTDVELGNMIGDIENILQYVKQLSELDTNGVEPTFQVSGRENIWREDDVVTQIPREDLLELAAETSDNQVKVPRVL